MEKQINSYRKPVEHSATGNGMRRADETLNNVYPMTTMRIYYVGEQTLGAKYRNHSYRRWCRGAVEASSRNSKTTFCL